MTITAYVTEKNGMETPFHVLDDGVLTPANGTLVLVSERNDYGHIKEGHIYAPGEWKCVNIQPVE